MNQNLYEHIENFIEMNMYGRFLTIQVISKHFNINRKLLHFYFLKKYDITIGEYLRRKITLIVIQEIAAGKNNVWLKFGANNDSRISNIFKKITGIQLITFKREIKIKSNEEKYLYIKKFVEQIQPKVTNYGYPDLNIIGEQNRGTNLKY